MELKFSKYQGTGNDFIIVDGFVEAIPDMDILEANVANLCDRRFGIGADGLIIIQKHKEHDFEMIYYNSDGNQSSMCGNGGRCIVHYAFNKSYVGEECSFLAIDGIHLAKASDEEIALAMNPVSEIKKDHEAFVLDTGSPHYVYLSDIPADKDFVDFAKSIRYGNTYGSEGINVNCLEKTDKGITVLTYERGVEDITYSCGTGVVAAAIASAVAEDQQNEFSYSIETRGGRLKVHGKNENGVFKELWLVGPAQQVFDGIIHLQNANQDFPKLH